MRTRSSCTTPSITVSHPFSGGRWGVESHEEGKPRLSVRSHTFAHGLALSRLQLRSDSCAPPVSSSQVRSANLRLRMDAAEQMGRDGGYDGGYAEEYVWLQTN